MSETEKRIAPSLKDAEARVVNLYGRLLDVMDVIPKTGFEYHAQRRSLTFIHSLFGAISKVRGRIERTQNPVIPPEEEINAIERSVTFLESVAKNIWSKKKAPSVMNAS
jgi:hypothetical protein